MTLSNQSLAAIPATAPKGDDVADKKPEKKELKDCEHPDLIPSYMFRCSNGTTYLVCECSDCPQFVITAADELVCA